MSMRPLQVPTGIAVTAPRVLGALLLLVALVAAAAWLGTRRRAAEDDGEDDVDRPLQRLRGFHIFGPDDDEADRVHVPTLLPVQPSIPPPPSAPAPAPQASKSNGSTPPAVTRTVIPPAPVQKRTIAPAPPAAVTLNGTAARPPRAPRSTGAKPNIDEQLGRDILIVEDDDTIATMYLMLLGAKGYTTRHARDGLEGISMVRKDLPALILLDMMMPRMDGLQFLEALRGWPKTAHIPVVVLSNVADHSLVERALALGAVEYLIKAQTRPQVLVGALPHWLRGNRALTV